MSVQFGRVRGTLVVALMTGLALGPGAEAAGRGGHGGGHKGGGGGHARAPRIPAAHRANPAKASRPARAPRAVAARPKTSAHANAARVGAANHAKAAVAHHATNTGPGTKVAPAGRAAAHPYAYTYGAGTHARHYRAHGYGRGYRNHYYGHRYGYGASQSANRAIVQRLRTVHANLARLDRDYQGHRVRAMHSIALAARQLSHRTMASGRLGRNGAGRRPMAQAQSDDRMGQALRSLQGIQMQLAHQATGTSSHARARGHLQRAIGHLNTALAIR